MTKVLVGITTYKRPRMLERLLRAIENFQTDAVVSVVVADNDSEEQQGVKIVKALSDSGYRFGLDSLLVEGRGFTYGRNAILNFGFSDPSIDFIAIMDDDQRPVPLWLNEMIKIQLVTKADVVGAAVWPEFEMCPPRWATTSKVYKRNTTITGQVDILTGDGGILVSSNFTSVLPSPWYDHKFAMTGGADVDLFIRLRAAGGKFARAADAVIYESYPPSRVNLRWALARAYRVGNTNMRLTLRHSSTIGRMSLEGVKIVAALIGGPIVAILFLWSPGRCVDALCKIGQAAGKVAALKGSYFNEYQTIHGS